MKDRIASAMRAAVAAAATAWLAVADPQSLRRTGPQHSHPAAPAADRVAATSVLVSVRCPIDGWVRVPAAEFAGELYTAAPHLSWFGFECPACGGRVTGSAESASTVGAMRATLGHSQVRVVTLPAEVLEEHPLGEMTADWVLDACDWLRMCPDLAAAAAVVDLTDPDAS